METLITITLLFIGGVIPPYQTIGAGVATAIEACGSPDKVVDVKFTCNTLEQNCDVSTLCGTSKR